MIGKIVRVVAIAAALAAAGWFLSFYLTLMLGTYLMYVGIFSIKAKREKYDKNSTAYKALTGLAIVLLIPGGPMDWLLNVVSSIPFKDKPAGWGELFTGRMTRYLKLSPLSSKFKAAYFMCRYMLHPWDEDHCGKLPSRR